MANSFARMIQTIDSHTEGNSTRVIVGGVPVPPGQAVDAVSLVPLLDRKGGLPERSLFWHYPHYSNQGGRPGGAIRTGSFKLLEFFEDSRVELYDTRPGSRPFSTSLLGALTVALGAQIAVGVIGTVVGDLAVGFILLAVIAGGLLLYIRVVIHDALLVEGAELGIGPDAPCPECHRLVPTMRFCPACGAARAAASKQGRARLAGGV